MKKILISARIMKYPVDAPRSAPELDEDPWKYTKMPDPKSANSSTFYPEKIGRILVKIYPENGQALEPGQILSGWRIRHAKNSR